MKPAGQQHCAAVINAPTTEDDNSSGCSPEDKQIKVKYRQQFLVH